ncbi:receptor-like protein 12 [Durio zibethinus]|uniref:Receptor-like protein 12 n=1 Tax=Durio zibethinus TaxID=66656 RepID=A0A6P5X1D7_DURZI|nr:receptor-like protein 12 [Durio zibethinus]
MVLVLRANRFYGPIKHVKNCFQDLDVLDIAFNNFSGQLPIEFFQAPQLRSLKIGGNKLKGKLPRSLAHCKKLEVLDVGKNMIQDTFPFWLVKLPSLKVLVLRANRFYGPIKISEDENAFLELHILDLASNNFSGELPVGFFQSLKAMKMMIDGKKGKPDYIGDDYYQDSVTIVNKGFELFYQKILTIFACLDFSNNSFHGKIPEEIQNLKSLKVLNLSYNSFLGPIPLALGNLTQLESLDLSQNKLSGKIPLQLTSLTFLAVLNLSYNQLEGTIPQSYQFGTFSNDSFKGNPRLCGPPLTKKCNEVGLGMPPPKEDQDSWVDVLNEMGNKWMDRFTWNRNKKWRRSSR